MNIGIGIDTGGTYTDAVAYDFDTRSVLGEAKALTTRRDLSVGILEALDSLPAELLRAAGVVSLSTTLATNACVEDRGGRAKLVFFGGDAKVIDELGAGYGLPPSSEIYIQPAHTNFAGNIERELDWGAFREAVRDGFGVDGTGGPERYWDGIGIIEQNSMRNGAVIERRAKEIASEITDVTAVCGYELPGGLNCLQRGAGALLNARLFPVIETFLEAIGHALKARGINAATVIVRSDGSLMSESFARQRPVETLLCGPAASVIGGTRLSGGGDCVVVDMGGTTTDIALVQDGAPVCAEGGVRVGRWKTFVDGLYIRTLGLGGDSAIHFNDRGLVLESYRAVPLCVAAARYPAVKAHLRELLVEPRRHTKFLHEHYMLARDITALEASGHYTPEELAFCRALVNGPLPKQAAAAAVGRNLYTLDVSRLLREEAVQVCGLTPTDLMHIRSDFNGWDAEAARLAAQYVAFNLDMDVERLCDEVYELISRRIYVNVAEALLENSDPDYMREGISPQLHEFIERSWRHADSGSGGMLDLRFKTNFKLVGIGAPTHIFTDRVARALGTVAVNPEHAGVANAVGAVAGDIYATYTVEVKPNYGPDRAADFTVFGTDGNIGFDSFEQAGQYALQCARIGAEREARLRGARGELEIRAELQKNTGRARDIVVLLGAAAVAKAVGTFGWEK